MLAGGLRLTPLCLLLAACGGAGGSGVGVTPAPPTGGGSGSSSSSFPLASSQSFAADSSTAQVAFDLVARTSDRGNAPGGAITVSYDAGRNSYTLSAPGRSQAFALGDNVSTGNGVEKRFRRSSGNQSETLTLVTGTLAGGPVRKYVQLGYWQSDIVTGNRQETLFSTFAYGFPTLGSAVPRTGTAGFDTDVFGLATVPGREPSVIAGRGRFDVDFLSAVFSTDTFVTETGLISGNAVSGGGLTVRGSGTLTSDGNFAGASRISGSALNVSGTIAGRFYGPGAEELGASFSGVSANGGTFTGALTGARDASLSVPDLALPNLTGRNALFGQTVVVSTMAPLVPEATFGGSILTTVGTVTNETGGSFTVNPGISTLPRQTVGPADAVAGAAAFNSFQRQQPDVLYRIDLYKVGSANVELPLTFTSLARYRATSQNSFFRFRDDAWTAYGIPTVAGLLASRTGTGTYQGVAYGSGFNRGTGQLFDVTGSSRFVVDFGAQRYTGSLTLAGRDGTGTETAFGTFDLAAQLAAFTAETTGTIGRGGMALGEIVTQFFGPAGEEIGGRFSLVVPPGDQGSLTTIGGVVAGRRQ